MSSRTCNLNFSGSKILTCSAYCSVHMRIALRLMQTEVVTLSSVSLENGISFPNQSIFTLQKFSDLFLVQGILLVCMFFFRISRMLKINIFLGCIPTMRGPLRPLYPTGTDFATTLCGEKRTSSFFMLLFLGILDQCPGFDHDAYPGVENQLRFNRTRTLYFKKCRG